MGDQSRIAVQTMLQADEYVDFLDHWQSDQAQRLAQIKAETGHVVKRFAPQPGMQTHCMASPADIVFSGGSAGSGKSYYLLLEPLRHANNGLMRAAFFRKTNKQIIQPGGLWDTARGIYPRFGGTPREGQYLDYRFKSTMEITFNFMAHDSHAEAWQGAQIPLTLWDELPHIKERHFIWVAVSRGRSVSGVPSYVHATMNPPDPDHWIRRDWVDWYIDEEGWPIPERVGVLRYFIRDGDEMRWGNSPEELLEKYPNKKRIHVKSFTLITGTLDDNQILKQIDPAYEGNIDALPYIERMRLKGNWNVQAKGGGYFKHEYFEIIDRPPADIRDMIRHWDMAATEPSEDNKDPDWTRGCLMAQTRSRDIIIFDIKGDRVGPGGVKSLIHGAAHSDRVAHGLYCTVGLEQEPGSSGKTVIDQYFRELSGFRTWSYKPDQNKTTRASLLSAHAERHKIYLVRGDWNKEFIREMVSFPVASHDDQVDAASGAFIYLTSNQSRDLSGW